MNHEKPKIWKDYFYKIEKFYSTQLFSKEKKSSVLKMLFVIN